MQIHQFRSTWSSVARLMKTAKCRQPVSDQFSPRLADHPRFHVYSQQMSVGVILQIVFMMCNLKKRWVNKHLQTLPLYAIKNKPVFVLVSHHERHKCMMIRVEILLILRYFSCCNDIYLNAKGEDANSNSADENPDRNRSSHHHFCDCCTIMQNSAKMRRSGERRKAPVPSLITLVKRPCNWILLL